MRKMLDIANGGMCVHIDKRVDLRGNGSANGSRSDVIPRRVVLEHHVKRGGRRSFLAVSEQEMIVSVHEYF